MLREASEGGLNLEITRSLKIDKTYRSEACKNTYL